MLVSPLLIRAGQERGAPAVGRSGMDPSGLGNLLVSGFIC